MSAADDGGVAIFDTPDTYKSLSPYLFSYIETDPLAIEEVHALFREGKFQRNDFDEWVELGMFDGVAWIAAEIENDIDDKSLFIEFRNPRMSFIDYYYPLDDGGFGVLKNGSAQPYSERLIKHPMPAFPLELERGEKKVVFFRCENVGDFRLRVWLWPSVPFAGHLSRSYYSELITIGGLFVLAVFHLLVSISLRNSAYFFLSLFIGSWLLFFMAGNGTGLALLWGDFSWLALRTNSIFAMVMNISFVLFTLSFLEARQMAPTLYRAGLILSGLCLLHLITCCFYEHIMHVTINNWLASLCLAYVAVLAVVGIKRGSRQARFYLFTFVFLLSGVVMMILLTTYVVSARVFLGTPIINVLFTTSILLWSLEITGRVKVRVREQQRLLEEEVKKRTHQLETALREVKTLSGLLPICSNCKKIRDDKGYWNNVEQYVCTHTDAQFTHGVCPDCLDVLYPRTARRLSMKTDGEWVMAGDAAE